MRAIGMLEKLWNMRNLKVGELVNAIRNDSDLKFLLTTVGAWYLSKNIFKLIIIIHIAYFVYHMFQMVTM